jgi:hypothetical protein
MIVKPVLPELSPYAGKCHRPFQAGFFHFAVCFFDMPSLKLMSHYKLHLFQVTSRQTMARNM